MSISAAQVKELRGKTGAGMMECKTALVENDGDFAKAEQQLKDRGLSIAKKREERMTNQGTVFGMFSDDTLSLLELRCETDFVSQNAIFVALGEECVREVHENHLTEANEKMKALIVDAVAVIKENLVINSIRTITGGPGDCLAGYVHGIGRIASGVKLTLSKPELRNDERIRTLASDLSLHVAAFGPQFVAPEEVSKEYRKGYEEDYRQEVSQSGKPERLWDQIVTGKWNKHLGAVCLTRQPYLRDEDITVEEAVGRVAREVGTAISIAEFVYIAIAPAVCL